VTKHWDHFVWEDKSECVARSCDDTVDKKRLNSRVPKQLFFGGSWATNKMAKKTRKCPTRGDEGKAMLAYHRNLDWSCFVCVCVYVHINQHARTHVHAHTLTLKLSEGNNFSESLAPNHRVGESISVFFWRFFGYSTPFKEVFLYTRIHSLLVNGIFTAFSHVLWRVLSNKAIWVLGHCWIGTPHIHTFEGDSVLIQVVCFHCHNQAE